MVIELKNDLLVITTQVTTGVCVCVCKAKIGQTKEKLDWSQSTNFKKLN